MATSPGEITQLLNGARNGDHVATAKLMPLVYRELHRRAVYCMRRERRNHTLQPTALVHEAYLRLVKPKIPALEDRTHFYAFAAGVMRKVLVDYARKKRAQRRGGSHRTFSLDEALIFAPEKPSELIALDEALNRLAELDPRLSRIVELRHFGGLSVEETAEVIGLSTRQVKRDWSVAKAWLKGEVSKHG